MKSESPDAADALSARDVVSLLTRPAIEQLTAGLVPVLLVGFLIAGLLAGVVAGLLMAALT